MSLKSIISAFTNKENLSFDSDFSSALNSDTEAIKNFVSELNQGAPAEDALRTHMAGASAQATSFANDLKVLSAEYLKSNDVVAEFETKQRLSEVSVMATDKSLRNCSSIINEYNSGLNTTNNICKNTGLAQSQLVDAVGASNKVMGNYLAGLGGASAKMSGYTKALIGAKIQTIGLQAANMALNAAIGMGIGLAIQGLIALADRLIVTSKEAIQAGEDAADN